MSQELRRAVMQAVNLVNAHSGQTSVHLRFADDPAAVDFVANSARIQGERFFAGRSEKPIRTRVA